MPSAEGQVLFLRSNRFSEQSTLPIFVFILLQRTIADRRSEMRNYFQTHTYDGTDSHRGKGQRFVFCILNSIKRELFLNPTLDWI